jgi:HlyD family secretion protein
VLKKILYGVAAVAVIGLIAVVARPKPLEVETAAVTRGPLQQVVDEDAKTRVRERYTVSAPMAGTLARIELHAGDPVEPGTVVAWLQPLPSPLLDPRAREIASQHVASSLDAHSQAAAAVVRAQAALQLAQSTQARDKELVAQSAVTPQQLEKDDADARMQASELESLRFAEKVAAHSVDEARLALGSFGAKQGPTEEAVGRSIRAEEAGFAGRRAEAVGRSIRSQQLELTSPVHGCVLHVIHEDSGVVTPGQALLEIGDPASLEVVVQVLSQDAVDIRPGMKASLNHWGGDHDLHARVSRVEPAGFTHLSALGVEEQRVNVLLDLDPGSEAKSLGDAFALEAQIVTWSGDDVPQIPTSALFRSNAPASGPRPSESGWEVFTIADGKAVVKPVKIGHRGPLHTEILDGIAPGELVISHPAPTLKAGAKVKPAQS